MHARADSERTTHRKLVKVQIAVCVHICGCEERLEPGVPFLGYVPPCIDREFKRFFKVDGLPVTILIQQRRLDLFQASV